MIRSEDIDKATALARLPLTREERVALERDLTAVVAHVDALFAADVDDADPLERGPGVMPRTRPDQVQPVLGRAALAAGAGFDGALVRVPKVID